MAAKDAVAIPLSAVTILGGTMYRGDVDCMEFASGDLYFVADSPASGDSFQWDLYAVDPGTGQEAGTPVYTGAFTPGTAPTQVNYEGNAASRVALASLPGAKYRLYMADLGTVTITVTLVGAA